MIFKKKNALDNTQSERGYEHFLHQLKTNPEVAESYETLLSSLHFLNSTQPLKSFLVTSTQPSEGKTTVTVNLALTMALARKNVLIIDADLRKPRIHHIFDLPNRRGLVDLMVGQCSMKKGLQHLTIPGQESQTKQTLHVLTSGQVVSNFFNMTDFPKLKESLEQSGNEYDMILFDSPPILAKNDSLYLASMVDGIIFVLRTGNVTEKEARKAKERLEQAGGRVVGIVMNCFDEKQHGSSLHPYGRYDMKTK